MSFEDVIQQEHANIKLLAQERDARIKQHIADPKRADAARYFISRAFSDAVELDVLLARALLTDKSMAVSINPYKQFTLRGLFNGIKGSFCPVYDIYLEDVRDNANVESFLRRAEQNNVALSEPRLETLYKRGLGVHTTVCFGAQRTQQTSFLF